MAVRAGAATRRRPRPREPLFEQAFGLQRFLHRRSLRHALHEGVDVLQAGEVHVDARRPVGDDEEIGVGGGEMIARQVVLARRLLVHVFVFLRNWPRVKVFAASSNWGRNSGL